MFSLRSSIAAVVLTLTALIPLSLHAAAPKPALLKGEWAVNMVKNEKGAFGYCLMRGAYSNGLQLAIALSPKGEVNVGVVVPEAGFTNGDKFPMAVAIDQSFRREHAGVAPQPDLIMMPLGPDPKTLAAIKSGKVISVEGPEDVALFSLKGSGKGLASLQTCVAVGTGKIKAPSAEKQAALGGAPTKGGKAPKFPPSLLQLLKSAGLKDLQIVSIADPSKAPVDFAWKTEGVVGGLRERPLSPDMSLEKMGDVIEAGYKKQCTGEFHSSATPPEDLPGVRLRTLDVSCDVSGHTAYVALLIYLTDNHLFSMFMHEGEGDKKTVAIHARDSIAGMIKKLAHEQAGKHPASAAPASSSPSAEPAPAHPDSVLFQKKPDAAAPEAPAASPPPAASSSATAPAASQPAAPAMAAPAAPQSSSPATSPASSK